MVRCVRAVCMSVCCMSVDTHVNICNSDFYSKLSIPYPFLSSPSPPPPPPLPSHSYPSSSHPPLPHPLPSLSYLSPFLPSHSTPPCPVHSPRCLQMTTFVERVFCAESNDDRDSWMASIKMVSEDLELQAASQSRYRQGRSPSPGREHSPTGGCGCGCGSGWLWLLVWVCDCGCGGGCGRCYGCGCGCGCWCGGECGCLFLVWGMPHERLSFAMNELMNELTLLSHLQLLLILMYS